ncbi:MAG: HD domain-containing protein [Eubacteriales bacterium]|nr:HD domain-containing protein [Eubacteriales bacterium]
MEAMEYSNENMEIRNMERIRHIQRHPLFQELWKKLQDAEKDRIFCRHTMEHFLDVARLMYIYSLEDGEKIRKDVIYAAALLHDIGRYEQIVSGTPHDIASAGIAEGIMKDSGFTADEIHIVQNAILGHRKKDSLTSEDRLTAYLYRADKKSRNCFACPAEAACDWPKEKKNLWIEY